MLYIDYALLKESYDHAAQRVNDLIDRKEVLFARTLPSAIRYDAIKVLHSAPTTSALDAYIEQEEKVEQTLRKARIIMNDRKEMLELKEKELRTSKDIDDIIFVMRSLERLKVERIAMKMGYSEGSVYYHLNKIKYQLFRHGIISDLK